MFPLKMNCVQSNSIISSRLLGIKTDGPKTVKTKHFAVFLSIRIYFSVFSAFSNFAKLYDHGNAFDFGDFDRCLQVSHKNVDNEKVLIKGKYCLVQYYSTQSEAKSAGLSKLHKYLLW